MAVLDVVEVWVRKRTKKLLIYFDVMRKGCGGSGADNVTTLVVAL